MKQKKRKTYQTFDIPKATNEMVYSIYIKQGSTENMFKKLSDTVADILCLNRLQGTVLKVVKPGKISATVSESFLNIFSVDPCLI
jgi:hypothetical protein